MSFSFDTPNFTYVFVIFCFFFRGLYYFWCSSVLVFLLKPGSPAQILEGHFAFKPEIRDLQDVEKGLATALQVNNMRRLKWGDGNPERC